MPPIIVVHKMSSLTFKVREPFLVAGRGFEPLTSGL
ncbi:hypothetical protein BACCAP_00560 [Pseudoflavonifractor capillosus ATCC 29799]|uniref:Uncharacterized protein n=1 Tax=Pseudoflavonifractor capillosus ATCC 29799 TaxID=411467 RepID=A6NQT9_9FIRM|nr:hypothetical protein BACCAP_00560 [Pseudoflavonifractor capillosus ATCC 29799]